MNREIPERREVVRFIKDQLEGSISPPTPTCHHYGIVELRMLLDLIYGQGPTNKEEELNDSC